MTRDERKQLLDQHTVIVDLLARLDRPEGFRLVEFCEAADHGERDMDLDQDDLMSTLAGLRSYFEEKLLGEQEQG